MVACLQAPEDSVQQPNSTRSELPGVALELDGAAFEWNAPAPLAFVTLWCSGEDPSLDLCLRVQATRPRSDGEGWEQLDAWCDPREALAPDECGSARLERLAERFGPLRDDLEGAGEDIWRDLAAFLAGHTVISPERQLFEGFAALLGGGFDAVPEGIGLNDITALFFPGCLTGRSAQLTAELATERERFSEAAITPLDLREALTCLAARFARLDDSGLALASSVWLAAWSRLTAGDSLSSTALKHCLQVLNHPSPWAAGSHAGELKDGRFARSALNLEDLPALLDDLAPRWTSDALTWQGLEPLPPDRDGPLPFHPDDAALSDLVFREFLPSHFGAQDRTTNQALYRGGQHEVAREVAQTIGSSGEAETQLLLVHAPTGTGKTLAYLVPALLWARRHEVRVGVATCTRALQEQAMNHEIPRALDAFRGAGLEPDLRVTVLKGRQNYLCWRALKLHLPGDEAPGEDWLAYAQLLIFSLTDPAGDLDRLPLRPPLATDQARPFIRALRDLVRHVRAQSSCCRSRDDRNSCAAEVTRWRAERSHLVITNHSFALARQDFFRHVIFDECEHLHDQTHAAWSHNLDLGEVGNWIERLEQPGPGRRRGLFRRIEKRLVSGTKSALVLDRARAARERLDVTREELVSQVEEFLRWRANAGRERSERDEHSLLREFAESHAGANLLAARARFYQAGSELDGLLTELAERLSSVAGQRLARLRRSLDIARTDLCQWLESVAAWIPLQEGQATFSPLTFHDVQTTPRGQVKLEARVLLPHEFLGRFYFPSLATATCLSATTWIKGGFDAAKAYTGLERAVTPMEDEERLPCSLRTFRAPEVFDYSRVLVAVPRDAPAASGNKDTFLAFVRDFLVKLCERTGGRTLVLFTNADDVKRVGARLEGHFRARKMPFWYQNMEGSSKEKLSELFRNQRDSILMGVDTFWYGADFPGETLEYLVMVRLPYGVPDRYHYAQCAALGSTEQRRQIYMPKALAKFRQGFGRLMRRVSDHGCVFMLDQRVLEPRHRVFLKELPIQSETDADSNLARLVRGNTDYCLQQAMEHMGLDKSAAKQT
jgi:Rad3-related DNA helicase